jgi:hypothetical protein
VVGDLPHDLRCEPALRLEDVVLGIMEAVLVVGADLSDDLGF